MGDGKGAEGITNSKPFHFTGMKDEPAAHCVIEIVLFAGAEQKIVTVLAVQFPEASMPVRPGIGEIGRVNQRRVGVGAEQQRPILGRQPGREGNCLLRLDDSIGHPWRSVIARRDIPAPSESR